MNHSVTQLPAPFVLKQSRNTPAVSFNTDYKNFEINGISFPEDSKQFFQPLLNYLKEHGAAVADGTIFKFKLDYFNTSSARCILDLMLEIDRIHSAGVDISILWYYSAGDDEMREVGEEYGLLIQCPIELKIML